MTVLNYSEENKRTIAEAENGRGYAYYVFTEEAVKAIAAKEAMSVEGTEWRSLLQMLYPDKLICSGLFEPLLIFEIKNGRRKDPPEEHWSDLVTPGSDGVLLERFISALAEHGIEAHESWRAALQRAQQKTESQNG